MYLMMHDYWSRARVDSDERISGEELMDCMSVGTLSKSTLSSTTTNLSSTITHTPTTAAHSQTTSFTRYYYLRQADTLD